MFGCSWVYFYTWEIGKIVYIVKIVYVDKIGYIVKMAYILEIVYGVIIVYVVKIFFSRLPANWTNSRFLQKL